MSKPAFFLKPWLSCCLLLILAACQSSTSPTTSLPAGGETPTMAVQRLVEQLKANNLAGYWQAALSPDNYRLLHADWQQSRPGPHSLKPEQQAEINRWLQQMSLPGASEVLYLGLKSKLGAYQAQYQDQLPMLFSVLQIILGTAVDQNPALSTLQKQHAHAVLAILTPWAAQAPWFDPERSQQTLSIACDTVRQSQVQDIAKLAALDFEPAMAKYSQVFAGLKQILALYGLDWQQSLDSVRLKALDATGESRRVQIDYQLLGQPLSFVVTTKHYPDGRWYVEDLQQAVQAAHQHLAADKAAANA